ncbi:hypothetical protein C8A01DRAFT_47403 [Parachaetomium inaequale]|uniref:Rhodopsin domain-containing protein n=1 Tax=Parachaetomium inaequale TaxID=2588326 RepID=A0AAN6PIA0_9PEZI|nr:hypothetical protein C8A01DRAFT_47403 [Parachaetomium inaequale]
MSPQVITETGYTKFNLSYPLAADNSTPAAGLNGGDETLLPGALFGLLVPHIVCTLFILARTYSRLFLLRKWFFDDTLIFLAWAFATTVCVIYSITTQSRSRTPLLPSETDTSTLPTYTALLLYQLSLLLTKLSTLAFYNRIFSSSSSSPRSHGGGGRPRLEQHLTRLTTLLVLVYAIPLLTLTILQCRPTQEQTQTQCVVAFKPLLITSTALHAATDAWLILLVIPCVWRLRDVTPRQRVVLGGVLSLGVFVVVVGVVRLRVALGLLHDTQATTTGSGTGSGNGDGAGVTGAVAFFVMNVLELDVAVICTSAPTLRPVLARVWPRLGMGMGEPGGRGDGGGGEGSVDLTSVVSYHGYPWTRNGSVVVGTPKGGSKGGSVMDVPPVPLPPPPPLVVAMHRTPTTLSLRSFVSGMAPRSRGRLEGEDRTGLLGEEDQGADGMASRRRSSVRLEAYYEQFVEQDDLEKRRSRCAARAEARYSRGSQCYSGRWGDSQESFVLGMNDPQSPKRLSPVSGLRELAKVELRRPGSQDEKSTLG